MFGVYEWLMLTMLATFTLLAIPYAKTFIIGSWHSTGAPAGGKYVFFKTNGPLLPDSVTNVECCILETSKNASYSQ